jgi:hypothetical protein
MSKNKKKGPGVILTPKADDVKPWNAIFRLPEDKKYRVYGFLVWLLGMLIIMWVFRS